MNTGTVVLLLLLRLHALRAQCLYDPEEEPNTDTIASVWSDVEVSPVTASCGADGTNNQVFIPSYLQQNYNVGLNGDNFNGTWDIGSFPDGDSDFSTPFGGLLPPLGDGFIPQTCMSRCDITHPRDQRLILHEHASDVIALTAAGCGRLGPPQKRRRRRSGERWRRGSTGAGGIGDDRDAGDDCPYTVGKGRAASSGTLMFRFSALVTSARLELESPPGIIVQFSRGGFTVLYETTFSLPALDANFTKWEHHITLQITGSPAGLVVSVHTDGAYMGSAEEFEVETVLPIEFYASDSFTGDSPVNIWDVRWYDTILTDREIIEAYTGSFPPRDVFSECLCPESHPNALSADDDLDLWCASHIDTLDRVRRDNPNPVEKALYLPAYLTDGLESPVDDFSNPTDFATYRMWLSTPGVEKLTLTVDLGKVIVISYVVLVSMTPPTDGAIVVSTRFGAWKERHIFQLQCNIQVQDGREIGCSELADLLEEPVPPHKITWYSQVQPGGQVLADAVRFEITGFPLTNFDLGLQEPNLGLQEPNLGLQEPNQNQNDGMTTLNYHAFSEIQVFSWSAGCSCYANGTVPKSACDYFGQCECREDIDPELAGKECGPYMTDITPKYGPESGGTTITISGQLLEAVTAVTLGNADCAIRYRMNTRITCRVPMAIYDASYPEGALRPVVLVHPCGPMNDSSAVYEYRPDPILDNIEPRQSFIAGGIIQTVTGQFLDSVAQPFMLYYLYDIRKILRRRKRQVDGRKDYYLVDLDETLPNIQDDPRLYTIMTALCRHDGSGSVMHCPVPPILLADGQTVNDDTDDLRIYEIKAYLGLWMDGVTAYRNITERTPEISELLLFINPEIHHFPEKNRIRIFKTYNQDSIEVLGERMMSGCSILDYTVTIGGEACQMAHLDSSTLICVAPSDEPDDPGSIHDAPRVKVVVGYIDAVVGYLDYTKRHESTEFYIGIGCAAAVIVLIIVIAIIWRARK